MLDFSYNGRCDISDNGDDDDLLFNSTCRERLIIKRLSESNGMTILLHKHFNSESTCFVLFM